MKTLHIAQSCLIIPLLKELESQGTNTYRVLKNVGLNKFEFEKSEMYVPLSLYYNLLTEIKDLGIDDFFNMFYNAQKTRNLSTYGDQIHLMPNLLEACQFAETYNQLLLSNETIQIETDGPITKCKVSLSGKKNAVWDEIELLTLSQIIHATRLAAGQDWVPQEIHLRTKRMPDFDSIINSNPPPIIKLGQENTQLVFRTEILAHKINIDSDQSMIVPNIPISNIEKMTSIIESCQVIPTIQEMSDYFDTSVSSLKRTLASEAHSYKVIIDNWRFKKAIQLVVNPNLQVKEIAYELRFNDPANFSRAFKRWTNFYPESYRDQL